MLRDDQSFVSGTPRLILRLEGFCLLAGSLWAFQVRHAGWVLFAVMFFAPDLSMLGYLVNPSIGAVVYNAVHTTIVCRSVGGGSALWKSILRPPR
jgi:hypothetical protein